MTWTNVSFPYASTLTAAKMAQLQANFAAIANADAGAPAFQTPAFDLSPVTQSKLSSATASGSVSIGSGASSSYALTGGMYSWWTGSSETGTDTFFSSVGVTFSGGNVAAGILGVKNSSGSSLIFYVDERYVQASPPYNLGNGDIPWFCFAKLKSGIIVATSVAPDPPWAYHGPTIITPDVVVNGRAFRLERFTHDGKSLTELTKNERRDWLHGNLQTQFYAVEIDQHWKNMDMGLIPHPFGQLSDGEEVVMVEPFDLDPKINSRELRDRLLTASRFTQSTFNTPPGVRSVRFA